MGFEKRDIVLTVGILFLMIGMIPFISPVYAIVIAIALFFGVRFFVVRKKKKLQEEVGEGICAVCGQKIVNKKCPVCDGADAK